MNLIRAAAAGRLVKAGPRLLFLSPPSLRGLGTILSFLRGRIEPPEDVGSSWLPELAGEAAFIEYATPTGAALLLHATTRRDHPDLTMDEAIELVPEMDEKSIASLVQVAFIRHVPDSARRPPRPPGDDNRPTRGIESFDFGRIFEGEAVRRFPPQVLAEMSLDQFENAFMTGDMEPEDALSFDEVMEIYETYRPRPAPGAGGGE